MVKKQSTQTKQTNENTNTISNTKWYYLSNYKERFCPNKKTCQCNGKIRIYNSNPNNEVFYKHSGKCRAREWRKKNKEKSEENVVEKGNMSFY